MAWTLGEGWTDVEVVSTECVEPEKGSDYVAVLFAAGNDRITARLYLSERAIMYTHEKLQKLGWEKGTTDLYPLTRGKDSPLAGLPASVNVEEEEYDGKRTMRVKSIGTGDGPRGVSGDDAKRFALKYAGAVEDEPASGGGDDDGLPF